MSEPIISAPVLFSAPGVAPALGVTSERARQLFNERKIPIVAWLNGKYPLTDLASLMQVKRQREERKRRRAA